MTTPHHCPSCCCPMVRLLSEGGPRCINSYCKLSTPLNNYDFKTKSKHPNTVGVAILYSLFAVMPAVLSYYLYEALLLVYLH